MRSLGPLRQSPLSVRQRFGFSGDALLDLRGEARHVKPEPGRSLSITARGRSAITCAASLGLLHITGLSRNKIPTSGCQYWYSLGRISVTNQRAFSQQRS